VSGRGAAPEADLFGEPEAVALRPRFSVRGNPRYAEVRIGRASAFFHLSALCGMLAEARAHAVEVGFLCMGRRDADPEGPYTIISELPVVGIGSRAHVEMPAEAKLEAQRRHAALDVVGWAHTHPDLGVFFSGTDVANCRQYGPAAINLVYDPVRDLMGIALGADMKVHVRPTKLLSIPGGRFRGGLRKAKAVREPLERPPTASGSESGAGRAPSKVAKGALFLCVLGGLFAALAAHHESGPAATERQMTPARDVLVSGEHAPLEIPRP
jgi:proteasome lid subunit RPN8/RPN11